MTRETVPLGALVKLVGGGTPSKARADYWGGGTPWITSADIAGDGTISERASVTDAGLAKSAGRVVPAGSVILVTRTGVGKAAITYRDLAFSQDIVAFSDHPHLDAGYLWHFLRASASRLKRSARGATILGVTREDVLGLSIPLPPLAEQRRIAAILDEADALRALNHKALASTESLARSRLHEWFGASAVKRVAIRQFAEVRSGSTPSRKEPLNYGGTVPWVKTGEVEGVIRSTSEHVTEAGILSARLQKYPAGSVIVAMYGHGKTRGKSAVLGIEATTNQACAVIVQNSSFDPTFLHAQLSSDYERLRGTAEGGTQPNLSLGRVASFEVALPPLSEQRAFASFVDRVETARTRMTTRANALDSLLASLQHRAFRGEL